MIKITNLNKYYNKNKRNEVHVINNTSLILPDKGLISILGTSGSGKTTLLNVIGGLDRAKGMIEFDDIKLENYQVKKVDKFRKDNIGYIFQNYNLLPEKTVIENLKIALELIDVIDPDEIDKRIEYTLKSVGMFKYRKKPVHALSGGQQQRVAIARALLKNSKIIIADEPTGNLDSENSIEVMNILKKISKNTLILLVTHNQDLAYFYSDRIIKIKDGVITDDNLNDDNSTLSLANNSVIFKKDLKHMTDNSSLCEVHLYSERQLDQKIDLEIYVKNGNYYLKSSKPIKILEESNIKVLDEHYTDLKKEHVDDYTYDTSWFKKERLSFLKQVKKFGCSFITGFKKFRQDASRNKFIYISFALLGAIISAAIVCLINFSYPDETEFTYLKDYDIMTSTDHIFVEDPILKIQENYVNGNIDDITIYRTNANLLWRHQYSFNKNINLSLKVLVARYGSEVDSGLIYGRAPSEDNEIVIDAITASEIAKSYGVGSSASDAIGKEVILNLLSSYKNVTIVGICNNSQRVVYGTLEFYTSWAASHFIDHFGDVRYYQYEVDANNQPLYDIITGRDVTDFYQSGIREVLLHHEHENVNDEYISIKGHKFKIVGSFKYKENTFDVKVSEMITNLQPRELFTAFNNLAVNENEYVMIEGRAPEKFDECMVSIYMNKEIGDTFDGRTIVGIYNGSKKALSSFSIVELNTYILTNYSYNEVCFKTVDRENVDLFENQTVISIFDYLSIKKQNEQATNLRLFELLSIVLLVFSIVFTYLSMRSKMITDVYKIGVYRSIGVERSKIIKETLIDLLYITIFTTFVGYVITLFIYNISVDSLNNLFEERIFKESTVYSLYGLLITFIINITIGVLPITFLLRKTPSEICSKYDI